MRGRERESEERDESEKESGPERVRACERDGGRERYNARKIKIEIKR